MLKRYASSLCIVAALVSSSKADLDVTCAVIGGNTIMDGSSIIVECFATPDAETTLIGFQIDFEGGGAMGESPVPFSISGNMNCTSVINDINHAPEPHPFAAGFFGQSINGFTFTNQFICLVRSRA